MARKHTVTRESNSKYELFEITFKNSFKCVDCEFVGTNKEPMEVQMILFI